MAAGALSTTQIMAGSALCALAVLLVSLTRERAGRFLALYAALIGGFFALDGIAVHLDSGPDAIAWAHAGHSLLFFAWPVLCMFASAVTGAHVSFWRRRTTIALAFALPVALFALEVSSLSPISGFEGGRAVAGPYWGLWMAGLMLYSAAFAYSVILLARSLARERDPEAIAGRALLLSAFIVPAARAIREGLSQTWRWAFLDPLGIDRPPLLPEAILLQVAVAVILSLLPAVLLRSAPSPRAREAGAAGIALATLVSIAVALGGTGEQPIAPIRWIFFALIVAYGALRHGLFGARRVALAAFERPLAAGAFGVLAILFVLAIDVVATDEIAIPGGIGVAVLATALVLVMSGTKLRPGPAAPRYSMERELGRGGGGRAMLALDTRLHRSVVLKRVGAGDDALREARAAARVSHPSLVAVHDVAEEPEGPVLVMEYVPGGTLEERLKLAPLGRAEAKRLALDLTEGLQALHDVNIVHGDVKAGNVFFRADGRAALGDFGSARTAVEETLATLSRAPASASLAGVAPEALTGERVDGRADVYGLGALLYRALTGESYLRFPPTFEDARHAVLTAPPLLPHARVPPGWERVLVKALAKDPSARYTSARGLREALLAVESA